MSMMLLPLAVMINAQVWGRMVTVLGSEDGQCATEARAYWIRADSPQISKQLAAQP